MGLHKKVLNAIITDLPDEINQLNLGLYNGKEVKVVTMNPPVKYEYEDKDKIWKVLNLPIIVILNNEQIKVYGF